MIDQVIAQYQFEPTTPKESAQKSAWKRIQRHAEKPETSHTGQLDNAYFNTIHAKTPHTRQLDNTYFNTIHAERSHTGQLDNTYFNTIHEKLSSWPCVVLHGRPDLGLSCVIDAMCYWCHMSLWWSQTEICSVWRWWSTGGMRRQTNCTRICTKARVVVRHSCGCWTNWLGHFDWLLSYSLHVCSWVWLAPFVGFRFRCQLAASFKCQQQCLAVHCLLHTFASFWAGGAWGKAGLPAGVKAQKVVGTWVGTGTEPLMLS